MKFVRLSLRFLCTMAILIIGAYTVTALGVAFFIVTGTLTPGDPMWIDVATPALGETLVFVCFGAAITACLAFARHKLSQRE